MSSLIPIPSDLHDQADAVCDAIREAVGQSGVASRDDVRVIAPSEKGFYSGDSVTVLLYLGTTAGAWFTSKWLDTYLWPQIKERIDGPSERILAFLMLHARKNEAEAE